MPKGIDNLRAALMAEALEWNNLFKALRAQKRRAKEEKARERQVAFAESKYFQYPADVVIYEISIEALEAAEKRKERKNFYWSAREYCYNSGKPYDLVDLFKIGE
jgi:hypothetical protein